MLEIEWVFCDYWYEISLISILVLMVIKIFYGSWIYICMLL